jgi:uncharacterized protein
VLLAIVLMGSGIARFYTDYLWFDALGRTDVFTRILGSQIALAAIFTAIFFVLAFVNLAVADRMRPELREVEGPDGEFLARYQELVSRRSLLVRASVALVFAIIAGSGTSSRWRDWLLFTNAVDFGTEDALFGNDVGFYVFRLPFLSFVVDWLFNALVIILVITAVAHYLNGSIRLQVERGQHRFTPQVKAHLSLLLGALALVRAGDYYLQRFELTVSRNGFVDGAGYTDVEARLPAIQLLAVISVFAFVLLVYNIRNKGWALPAIAVGLWAVVAFVANTMYPAFVQRFQVQPAQSRRENTYIQRNIDATRAAYGLSFPTESLPITNTDGTDVTAAAASLRSATLMDPTQLLNAWRAESAPPQYRFNTLDASPYTVDGDTVPYIIGVRELNNESDQSWENRHINFPYGYGVLMAPANRAAANGIPAYSVRGIPVQEPSVPSVTRPEIYFGEDQTDYSVANAVISEDADLPGETRYSGSGGVQLNSTLRRAAFAARFQNVNLLISDSITSESRIIYGRNVQDRLDALAPFLRFDNDPYPVVVDGSIKWITDGYTTTDRYPYSQRFETRDDQIVPSGLGTGGFNYVRNSVKAVIDAYSGEVTFYVTDPTDPLIRSYQSAFPDLFTEVEDAPTELRERFRYPSDMFRVQTTMWARYHQGQATQFFNGNNRWNVSPDPGSSQEGAEQTVVTNQFNVEVASGQSVRMAPVYQQVQRPGEADTTYAVVRSFVPFDTGDGRTSLTSFMMGELSPDGMPVLTQYTVTEGTRGPQQAQQALQRSSSIAEQLSLLDDAGSEVDFGAMQLVPAGDSILYVRPVYISSNAGNQTGPPGLGKVVVITSDGRAFMGDDLEQAVALGFGQDVATGLELPESGTASNENAEPTPPTDPSTPTEPTQPLEPGNLTAEELLAEAQRLFEEADAALAAGDLGRYQDLVEDGVLRVEQANAALNGSGSSDSGSTTTTTPPNDASVTTTTRSA